MRNAPLSSLRRFGANFQATEPCCLVLRAPHGGVPCLVEGRITDHYGVVP